SPCPTRRSSDLEQSLLLAAQSAVFRPHDPARSMMAAVAAWRSAGTVEARSALFDAEVQPFTQRLGGHTDAVTAVAITDSGDRVATGSGDNDKTIELWRHT